MLRDGDARSKKHHQERQNNIHCSFQHNFCKKSKVNEKWEKLFHFSKT